MVLPGLRHATTTEENKAAEQMLEVKDLQRIAGRAALAAEDKKAEDVRVLQLAELTPIADYFVIASATNRVQLRTIAEAVEQELKQQGLRPGHVEGVDGSGWVLLDFRDIVVHIFLPESRSFFGLERLWGDAKEIDYHEFAN